MGDEVRKMRVIAIDAMGGDHAPGPEVSGAVAAVEESSDIAVVLVGDSARIEEELARHQGRDVSRISVVPASEVVLMTDSPTQAFRQKKDSSLRVAFEQFVSGKAHAVVSAGNSGAVLAHSLFLMKRLPSVERPAIVTVFPTPGGRLVLCDMGANVEVKPTTLAQFAILGAHYDRIVHPKDHLPRVGLLSNGTEASKGTELTRAAHKLLESAAAHVDAQFEYLGYVEGSEIFRGHIDVVATDGFTGNIVLKTAEGVSEAVLRMVKRALSQSISSKLGAFFVKPALMELRDSLHYSDSGGALLAGVRGVATICHGRSDSVAIKNAVLASKRFLDLKLVDELAQGLERHQILWADPNVKDAAKNVNIANEDVRADGANEKNKEVS